MAANYDITLDKGSYRAENLTLEILTDDRAPLDATTNPYIPFQVDEYNFELWAGKSFGFAPTISLSSVDGGIVPLLGVVASVPTPIGITILFNSETTSELKIAGCELELKYDIFAISKTNPSTKLCIVEGILKITNQSI